MTEMKLQISPSLSRLLFLLACLSGCGLGRGLHLGTCSVTIHTHELRRHYTEIRTAVVASDSELGVRMIRGDMMKSIPEKECCCFLRLLLNFYVERVFISYGSSQPQHRRATSALANSFLTINKDLKQCHCYCGEDTRTRMDSIQAQFAKLKIQQAAIKALGELDSLLDWLERLITDNSHKHLHIDK